MFYSFLKNSGIYIHQLKRDFLGSKASISKYDLYKDATGKILILQKGGIGTPIRTGEFIK
ncbi:polymorphic toxin type 33 domain-containing protein [Paenimyroides ummariense]|uniref:polymorphic toxin type 33 domain-containing protein n=1 Tax=Paenimyroides ummariense TaxID=913024 RepID=UPI000B846F40